MLAKEMARQETHGAEELLAPETSADYEGGQRGLTSLPRCVATALATQPASHPTCSRVHHGSSSLSKPFVIVLVCLGDTRAVPGGLGKVHTLPSGAALSMSIICHEIKPACWPAASKGAWEKQTEIRHLVLGAAGPGQGGTYFQQARVTCR